MATTTTLKPLEKYLDLDLDLDLEVLQAPMFEDDEFPKASNEFAFFGTAERQVPNLSDEEIERIGSFDCLKDLHPEVLQDMMMSPDTMLEEVLDRADVETKDVKPEPEDIKPVIEDSKVVVKRKVTERACRTPKVRGSNKASKSKPAAKKSSPSATTAMVAGDNLDKVIFSLFPMEILRLERASFNKWKKENGIRKLTSPESKRLAKIRRTILARVYAERARQRRDMTHKETQEENEHLREENERLRQRVEELEKMCSQGR